MSTDDHLIPSKEELEKILLPLAPHALQQEIYDYSPQEIALATQVFADETLPNWKEKNNALYLGVSKREQAEAIGKNATPAQVNLMILSTAELEIEDRWRLAALLVGLSHEDFCYLLRTPTPLTLQILQHQSQSESLQYHIALIIHKLESQDNEINLELEALQKEIQALNPQNVDRSELQNIFFQIEEIAEKLVETCALTNQSLSLAWNTGREDLIEQLTKQKESASRFLLSGIGRPRTKVTEPSGIFSIIDTHLGQIFESAELSDDAPTIEALTRWSVWYLRDYWELGLLPEIQKKGDLRLSSKKHSKEECLTHRQTMMETVRKNLEHLGLKTVADLKRNQIFSKELLKEFIEKNSLTVR